MAEAKERFTRGLKLYGDGNYEGARVEFERAYGLAPSYKLLYNIGYCYRQLNDYVAAIRALERFLAEGAAEIPQERKYEVTNTLADLRTRIASIEVNVFEEKSGQARSPVIGATVTIDDVPVGTTPLKEPIVVNPGRRKVSASEKGGSQVTQIVTVAGRETARVNLELSGPRTIVVERKERSLAPYIAWGVTGLLVAGTVVTGVLALSAKNEQEDLLKELGQTPRGTQQNLDDARTKTQTLGTVSDILLASSIVGAGVATFFTIKSLRSSSSSSSSSSASAASEKASRPSVRGGVGLGGLVLSGQF
jgi:hypothetical protein